ncbi:hypothetical protein [Endozoicomonas sp. ONNA2]|uniref:hypothetical protein n=1 Tax=Endozoicomonas sp. ONNA2 TaxID=2828741 RepID=UPI002147A773|nr:hypothetical protein [Endozoicomonas sp. ONNA2]
MVNLCNRSIRATEDQVVIYNKRSLLLKKKLCDRGNEATAVREQAYFAKPSPQTLSHLLKQFQSTYLKFWELQRAAEFRPEDMPESVLSIGDEIEQLENHMVDFLLSCSPSDSKQIQELFLMCLWFEGVKVSKDEQESANYAAICRLILSFFENNKISNIPIEKINERFRCCDPINQIMEPYDKDLLPDVIVSCITHSLVYLLNFRETETIKANIKAFIYESELFKTEDCTLQPNLEKKLTISGICASGLNILHKLNCNKPAILPDSHGIPDLNPDSLLFHALMLSESNQIAYNSPDISLSAVEQLFRFLQIPELRKKLVPLIKQYMSSNKGLKKLVAVCSFLLNQDTLHLINIPNKDIRLYLSAVFYCLKNEPEKAESELLKSRIPQAHWLLSKIYGQGNRLEEAIQHARIALKQGVNAANLPLALLLIKNSKNEMVATEEVLHCLKMAIKHYDFINAKEISFYIQGIIDELELFEIKPAALEAAPGKKKKSTRQRHRSGPTGKKQTRKIQEKYSLQDSMLNTDLHGQKQSPDFSEDQGSASASEVCGASIAETSTQAKSIKSIHRTRLSYISLCVTHFLHNNDFDQARAVLNQFCQDTQLTIQQASFAHMDLWSLRVMAKGSEHLEACNASARQEQKPFALNILCQSGKALTDYGLDRKDCETIFLSDDTPKDQFAIRNLIIDKALGWLCCLHPKDQNLAEYKAQWLGQPSATARGHLAEFEHSLTLTFVTGSFLSLLGHVHSDMALDCDDQKKRLKQKSGEFYSTANEFNKWRICLKDNPTLLHRIAKKTPLGDIQRLKKNNPTISAATLCNSAKDEVESLPPPS